MSYEQFLKTIYLGDRGVMGYELRSDLEEFRILIDSISLITGDAWDPNCDPEFPNAKLLFTGVKAVTFSPPGALPNDYIHSLICSRSEAMDALDFILECDASDSHGSVMMTIKVSANSISLEK